MAGIDNVGSTARDFAMLERNLLSHVKLALMLSLVSFSVLLKARLVPETSSKESVHADARIPVASVQMVAALCALASGAYEYHRSFRDMLQLRAFLKGPERHVGFLILLAIVVITTAILLLVGEKLL